MHVDLVMLMQYYIPWKMSKIYLRLPMIYFWVIHVSFEYGKTC